MKAKALIAAVLAAFLFGAGCWVTRGYYAPRMAQLKQAHAEQNARHAAATLHRYTEMEAKKDEAIQAHKRMVTENAAAADAARRAVDGLQQDLAKVPLRIAAATREAVDQYAATAGELLGACTAEYQWMADKAAGHAADAKLMDDAWPK